MLSLERSSGAGFPLSNPEVGGAGSIEVYVLPKWVNNDTRRGYNVYLSSVVDAEQWTFPSGELSHSILASAISQVSRTERLESFRYRLRTGIEDSDEIAPMASAAYGALAASMNNKADVPRA
jgi:hypothetical protein